jgi:hypothetical protein
MNEIPIKSITIAPGSTIHKTILNTGQPGFGIATVVTLAHGHLLPILQTLATIQDSIAALHNACQ